MLGSLKSPPPLTRKKTKPAPSFDGEKAMREWRYVAEQIEANFPDMIEKRRVGFGKAGTAAAAERILAPSDARKAIDFIESVLAHYDDDKRFLEKNQFVYQLSQKIIGKMCGREYVPDREFGRCSRNTWACSGRSTLRANSPAPKSRPPNPPSPSSKSSTIFTKP